MPDMGVLQRYATATRGFCSLLNLGRCAAPAMRSFVTRLFPAARQSRDAAFGDSLEIGHLDAIPVGSRAEPLGEEIDEGAHLRRQMTCVRIDRVHGGVARQELVEQRDQRAG